MNKLELFFAGFIFAFHFSQNGCATAPIIEYHAIPQKYTNQSIFISSSNFVGRYLFKMDFYIRNNTMSEIHVDPHRFQLIANDAVLISKLTPEQAVNLALVEFSLLDPNEIRGSLVGRFL